MQNGEIDVEPLAFNYRRPTEMFCMVNKDNMRKFSRVNVSRSEMKILLLSSVKHQLVVKRLSQAGHLCDVAHDIKEGLQLISTNHHQVMVVDAVSSDISLEEAANELHSKPFSDGVILIALVKSVKLNDCERMKRIAELGYARVISNIDFLESELHFVENNELAMRNRLLFAEALFEATEYCNDGVEITSVTPDFRLVYANKSYSDMIHEEEDVIKQFPEGESRRKHSRQIISIHNPHQEMVYQVTLRPNFHVDGGHHLHSRTSSLSSRHGKGSLGSLSQTRAVVETPIMKVINMLQMAQNTDECSVEIRETLENTMEILRKVPDIYSPNLEENEPISQSAGVGGGFMYRGLLRNPRRQSQNFDSLPRGYSLHSPHHTNKIACLATPSQIRKTLDNIKTWKYNIMELEAVSFNQPLYYLGMEVFTRWFKVDEFLCVDETVIGSWLQLMENKYHSSNTYHNSTHAADVLQAGAYFLQKLIDRGDSWEPLDIASVLIAMVVHDLDHPGRTNNFLSNSRHELAILYNDKSILENHHVATAFKETSESTTGNIFKSLETESYQSIRQNIVEMVLATDMSKHFEHLSKFTTGVNSQSSGDFPSASSTSLDKDQIETDLLVKRILVKSADLANPARPLPICKEWAVRISTEYFSQTEEEKKLGLPVVMPAFDRTTCNFPQTQVQFIDFIVTGLFEAWNNYVDISEVINELESNYKFWKDASSDPNTEVRQWQLSL